MSVSAGIIKPMIIGGQRVLRRNMPWATLLTMDGSVLCGGSLITQTCILTAAHCIYK